MLLWASLILFGVAVFIVTSMMFLDESEYKAQEKLEQQATVQDSVNQQGVILRYSRPFFKRYVTPIVSSMKSKKKIREKYKRKLASAGLTEILTPEDFFSFKLFLILGFPIVFFGVRWFIEADWPLSYIPLISGFGFF